MQRQHQKKSTHKDDIQRCNIHVHEHARTHACTHARTHARARARAQARTRTGARTLDTHPTHTSNFLHAVAAECICSKPRKVTAKRSVICTSTVCIRSATNIGASSSSSSKLHRGTIKDAVANRFVFVGEDVACSSFASSSSSSSRQPLRSQREISAAHGWQGYADHLRVITCPACPRTTCPLVVAAPRCITIFFKSRCLSQMHSSSRLILELERRVLFASVSDNNVVCACLRARRADFKEN